MRYLITTALLLMLMPLASAQPAPEAVVRANSAAFNAQDVEALASTVAEDFTWYNVDGEKIGVETRGRDALRKGMAGYFKSLPSARSEIESLTVNGNFVAVRERAKWKSKSGEDRSQSALAVYEVKSGLIARVWYYPAHR